MGAFYRDQYDFYKDIKKDVAKTSALLRQAILAATGEDFEQDLKDSCVGISEHKKYDFAFKEVDFLWRFIQEKIGTEGEIIT